jgi:putative oxidoreductase
MKKLFSTYYSAGAFSAAMLILRLSFGIFMAHIGYQKLVNFGAMQHEFMNFMGLGSSVSLALCIFAEFFCSIFLILGLFTRLSTIPLIITMCVIIFQANKGVVLEGGGNIAALYLTGYIVLLFVGPGRVSVDSMIGK